MALGVGLPLLIHGSTARADTINSPDGIPILSVGTTPSDNAYGIIAVSNGGTAQGNVAVSAGGTANGDVAFSAGGNANALCLSSNDTLSGPECEQYGVAYTDAEGPGGMDLFGAALSNVFPDDPDSDGIPGVTAAGDTLSNADLALAAPAANLPSCRSITYRGNTGYIAVQVDGAGYLQWGIHMYAPGDRAGRFVADLYVNGNRKDHKDQSYEPHGSLPPSQARSGGVFQVKAFAVTIRSFFGIPYIAYHRNVPNGCLIP